MGSSHLLVAAVVLLVVVVQEGSSLECVECNSFIKTDCETQPLAYIRKCNESATSCRKMEQEIYYDDDYHVRTIRQCAYEPAPLKCIERTGTYRIKIYYCHCNNEDNCNSAGVFSLSLLLASVCAVVGYLFRA